MKIVFEVTFQIYQRKKRIFCANRLALQSCRATLMSISTSVNCPVEVFFPWGGARVILPHLAGGCTDIKICLTWWRLQQWLSVHAVTPELQQLTQSDCCHLTAVCNFEIFCKSSMHGVQLSPSVVSSAKTCLFATLLHIFAAWWCVLEQKHRHVQQLHESYLSVI